MGEGVWERWRCVMLAWANVGWELEMDLYLNFRGFMGSLGILRGFEEMDEDLWDIRWGVGREEMEVGN